MSLKQKNYDKAIRLLTELLKTENPTASAYYLRASAYDAKGQFEKAMEDYAVSA